MVIWPTRFNIYLACLLSVALLPGCKSAKDRALDKNAAMLHVHLEVSLSGTDRSKLVPITSAKLMVNVEKEPFLTEIDIAEAKVIEALGGYSLQIQFDRHGSITLEQYSARNPGRRFAIFARFGEKLREQRWLAAPKNTRHISNGMLVFAPDASREEAEQIALGLNNVAAKVQGKKRKGAFGD